MFAKVAFIFIVLLVYKGLLSEMAGEGMKKCLDHILLQKHRHHDGKQCGDTILAIVLGIDKVWVVYAFGIFATELIK